MFMQSFLASEAIDTSLPSINKSLPCLFPGGVTAVWGLLAWSVEQVQHSRHESFLQGHLLAVADKRQLFAGALSVTLLQGSIEKRRRHLALYQIFYSYDSNPPLHIHMPHLYTSYYMQREMYSPSRVRRWSSHSKDTTQVDGRVSVYPDKWVNSGWINN